MKNKNKIIRTYKENRLNQGKLIYAIINICILVGAIKFISNNFIIGNNIPQILFGGLLLLIMIKYVLIEIIGNNPIETWTIKVINEGKK